MARLEAIAAFVAGIGFFGAEWGRICLQERAYGQIPY